MRATFEDAAAVGWVQPSVCFPGSAQRLLRLGTEAVGEFVAAVGRLRVNGAFAVQRAVRQPAHPLREQRQNAAWQVVPVASERTLDGGREVRLFVPTKVSRKVTNGVLHSQRASAGSRCSSVGARNAE